MPDTLIDADAAWDAISVSIDGVQSPELKIDAGSFVPVIGPQVALTSVGGAPDQQSAEVARACVTLLNLAKVADDPKVRHYLTSIASWHEASFPVSPAPQAPAPSPPEELTLIADFQIALAELGCRLSQVWAKAMLWQPEPMSPDQSYETSYQLVSRAEMCRLFRTVLGAAYELEKYSLKHTSGVASSRLRITLVRPRLLRLLAETMGEDLWSEEWTTFLDDYGHKALITAWKGITGFQKEGRRPCKVRAWTNAIALRHLLWIEDLLWYTALAPTTAYRSGSELAFTLSLFERDMMKLGRNDLRLDAPRLYELGFLYSSSDESKKGVKSLIDLLQQSNTAPDRLSPRPPSPLHLSLAQLVARNQSRLDAQKQSVVLTSTWDLDIHRAMASTVGRFISLVPVWLPLAQGSSGAPASSPAWMAMQMCIDDSGQLAADTNHENPYWLVGAVARDESALGYDPASLGLPWEEGGMTGPVVVSVAGCPLAECGTWSKLPNRQARLFDGSSGIQIFNLERDIRHRLLADEADLLGYLDYGPLPCGIREQLSRKRLFFFGHPASSLSERAHYFALSRQVGDSVGADAGTTARYALDKPTAFGELALSRWHVEWVDDLLKEVMATVIARTAPAPDGTDLDGDTEESR